jgi:hypothetical protein
VGLRAGAGHVGPTIVTCIQILYEIRSRHANISEEIQREGCGIVFEGDAAIEASGIFH